MDKMEPLIGNIALSDVALDRMCSYLASHFYLLFYILFAYCFLFGDAAFVKYATPEFIKAFNVSQMLVQYLNFQSETLVARILQMNDEYPILLSFFLFLEALSPSLLQSFPYPPPPP